MMTAACFPALFNHHHLAAKNLAARPINVTGACVVHGWGAGRRAESSVRSPPALKSALSHQPDHRNIGVLQHPQCSVGHRHCWQASGSNLK